MGFLHHIWIYNKIVAADILEWARVRAIFMGSDFHISTILVSAIGHGKFGNLAVCGSALLSCGPEFRAQFQSRNQEQEA
jgi:hypothetical protein